MIKIGFVGLPNVGKSSFFKLLTKLNVVIENFSFSTIEPNIAVVNYHDQNLTKLAPLYKTQKIIYEQAMIYDIAGLVKGASTGVGLGNNFLAHIQEVDLICHIIKCFGNNVTPSETIDNYEIINLELIIHDQKILNTGLRLWTKKIASPKPTKIQLLTVEALKKIKTILDEDIYLFSKIHTFKPEELLILKQFCFLTLKPVIVLANISESDILSFNTTQKWAALRKMVAFNNSKMHSVPVNFLLELAKIESLTERTFFLTDYQKCQDQIDVNVIINEYFRVLGYSFFFTCGEKEVHAWNFIENNNNIKNVVSKIHSSFSDNFIMAKVINYEDVFHNHNSPLATIYSRFEKTVNKKYTVKYGDIINVLLRN